MSLYSILHTLLKYDKGKGMIVNYIPRNRSFEFWDNVYIIISGV